MVTAQSTPRFSEHNYMHYTALQAYAAGISVIPIRNDGTKQPSLFGWKQYQQRLATEQELSRWFRAPGLGIAFITGTVSGELEAMDFDCFEVYQAWLAHIKHDPRLHALYERISWGYEEATPSGGRHLLYRSDTVEGNQKLARRPVSLPERFKSLIETRGEGGLIIVAPSRGGVHPSGKTYMLRRGGVSTIQKITPKERDVLLASARAFDEVPPPVPRSIPARPGISGASVSTRGPRPGDLYNRLATWEEVLLPHGWQLVRYVGEEGQWRRPGKTSPGISATTNHNGHDLLYVFSTSTVFEPERGHTKFKAYAILNHGGDLSVAERELVKMGYTTQGKNVTGAIRR